MTIETLKHAPPSETERKLLFAHQLYRASQKRYGDDHEQTRLILGYLRSFEKPPEPGTDRS